MLGKSDLRNTGFSMKNKNRNTADTENIAPAEFTPLTKPIKKRRRMRPVTVSIVIALLIAGVAIWYLLSARAVFFDTEPATAQLELDYPLIIRVSDSYLMRSGTYKVKATADGYFDLEQEIIVSDADSQHIPLILKKKPGHLNISTTPDTATIVMDGIELGQTPTVLRDIAPGSHTLELQAPRYFSETLTVDIEGLDKTQTLEHALRQAWGSLSLESTPAGAEVFVSGESRGHTPLTTELLEWGEEVKLQLSGHKSWQRRLDVKAGEELSITDIKLDKVDGLLRLNSMPSGASVTVDGKFRGRTPVELALKPDVGHQLSLFLDGYLTSKRSVTIPSGNEKQLDVKLTSETGKLRVVTSPADATVLIDGVVQGKGGDTFALPARAHRIEVRRDGYASKTKSFTPRPGIKQMLKIELMTEAEARWAATPREITSPVGQALRLFRPEVTFSMGASRREPGRRANEIQRDVTLKRPFYLATKEVTNAEFNRFNAKHFSRQTSGVSLSQLTQPVVNVSWEQAALYCNWLSASEGLPLFYTVENDKVTGFDLKATGYRLPTEAEWSWAARQFNSHSLKFAWGDSFPPSEKTGNYADRSAAKIVGIVVKGYNDGYAVSAPVSKFPANDKGLYDLDGNVAEWINDYYGIEINLSSKPLLDPTGPEKGEFRVIRGASWRHGSITELRLSFRDYGRDPRDDVGFRIARYVESE